MPEFCTFLVFSKDQTHLVSSLCLKAGWNAKFIQDPSKRYRFNKFGYTEVSQARALSEASALRPDEYFGELLVIKSKSNDDANNIINLIIASAVILEAFPNTRYGTPAAFELPEDSITMHSISENVFQKDGFFEKFVCKKEILPAIAMASIAWTSRGLIYAIHKLALSYQLEAITPWSVHPVYGQLFEKHSSEFLDHVRSATAINTAYSAIEDLKLQVKSSLNKPRWLDNTIFSWNPAVLNELVHRIVSAGINPETTIRWIVRGDKTEVDVQPLGRRPLLDSINRSVRDTILSLPDAIHAASYLRNFMTAHAFGDETSLIGPYEVFNVQQLSRCLILQICGELPTG